MPRPKRPTKAVKASKPAAAPAVTRRGFLGAVAVAGAAVVVDRDRPAPTPRRKVRWIGHW